MPRLTQEQWAEARVEWEDNPTMTLNYISQKYDIHRSEVTRRAQKESWTKTRQIEAINEAAHRIADAQGNPTNPNITQHTPKALSIERTATRIESVTARAEVLDRHRKEWLDVEVMRKVALKAMKTAHDAKEYDAWKVAKMAAETARANLQVLEIKQNGERKAWGLDLHTEDSRGTPEPVSVTFNVVDGRL